MFSMKPHHDHELTSPWPVIAPDHGVPDPLVCIFIPTRVVYVCESLVPLLRNVFPPNRLSAAGAPRLPWQSASVILV